MDVPSLTLPGGDELPTLGFGTWNLHGDTLRTALGAALDAGYTHVDTAEGYENEAVVGEVLAEHDREELFLTSKVLAKHLHYGGVIEACEASLDRLGTDYLDLYLIHWPNPAVSLRETMAAMARLRERGLVRNVGVSNFTRYQLGAARRVADAPIAVNQIEFHPWFQRPDLVEYCREAGIAVAAAAPLARTEVLEDPVVEELAASYDRSPARIVLRWALESDAVVLPKSSSPEHVRANAALFDWSLDSEDRRRLDERDRDRPVYDTGTRDWSDDVWGIPE